MKNLECAWNPPPPNVTIQGNDIHVWCADLCLPAFILQQYAEVLSPDEHARAARFLLEKHRRRFIAARGLLRIILSRYLHVAPNEIRFSYSQQGKPSLASTTDTGLVFSVSHSNDLALIAISCTQRIGIDLEYVHPMPHALHMAQRFFSPNEYALICSLPSDKRPETFLTIWTLKEAYVKATGEGIAGLKQVEFSQPSDEQRILVRSMASRIPITPWSAYLLTLPVAGYVSALVVEAHNSTLSFFLSDHLFSTHC